MLPNKYLLEEGKEAPDGTVVKKCKYCNSSFAIPVNEAAVYEKTNVCDNPDCIKKADQEAALAAASLMKKSDSEEVLRAALGN